MNASEATWFAIRCDRRRLARARPREDADRSAHRLRGEALLGVEPGEDVHSATLESGGDGASANPARSRHGRRSTAQRAVHSRASARETTRCGSPRARRRARSPTRRGACHASAAAPGSRRRLSIRISCARAPGTPRPATRAAHVAVSAEPSTAAVTPEASTGARLPGRRRWVECEASLGRSRTELLEEVARCQVVAIGSMPEVVVAADVEHRRLPGERPWAYIRSRGSSET